jgi:pilus assembly protein Flp/PilA
MSVATPDRSPILYPEDSTMKLLIRRLTMEEEGATMVEYPLVVALIGAALVVVVRSLGTAISGKFSSVSGSIAGAS